MRAWSIGPPTPHGSVRGGAPSSIYEGRCGRPRYAATPPHATQARTGRHTAGALSARRALPRVVPVLSAGEGSVGTTHRGMPRGRTVRQTHSQPCILTPAIALTQSPAHNLTADPHGGRGPHRDHHRTALESLRGGLPLARSWSERRMQNQVGSTWDLNSIQRTRETKKPKGSAAFTCLIGP